MATEQQTLNAPGTELADDSHQPALLRATHILRRLQHAARAARLEAQVVELEAAIAKAHAGDVRVLQAWLDHFDDLPATTVFTSTAIGESSSESCAKAGGQSCGDIAPVAEVPLASALEDQLQVARGWSSYLLNARQRLDAIQHQHGDALPWPGQTKTSSAQLPQLERISLTDHSSSDPVHDSCASDAAIPADSPALPTTDLGCSTIDDEQSLEDAAEQRDEQQCEQRDEQLSEESLASLGDLRATQVATAVQPVPLSKRIFGSYGFSMAGHVILLIILGSITYQAPDQGSSLGSQVLNAAEASSEMELTSEVEMLEPAELSISEPLASSTPTTPVASELSQISPASPVTVEATTEGAIGSSIASAISEATGKSASGSRESGAPSINGSFFGVGSGGNYFCYVVDSSGSMRGGAWDSAKAELVRSLKSLKPTQKFYIVFFADEFEALPEPGSDQPAASGLYATPENIDHARHWIQSIQLKRGGPPTQALAWAIEREPDAIYLLTDGVTKVDVCGFLRKNNRIEDIVSGSQVRVPIHAIAYFSLDGQQLMRQLAKENQGQFIYVPKSKK